MSAASSSTRSTSPPPADATVTKVEALKAIASPGSTPVHHKQLTIFKNGMPTTIRTDGAAKSSFQAATLKRLISLTAGSQNPPVKLWKLEDGKYADRPSKPAPLPVYPALAPDGRYLWPTADLASLFAKSDFAPPTRGAHMVMPPRQTTTLQLEVIFLSAISKKTIVDRKDAYRANPSMSSFLTEDAVSFELQDKKQTHLKYVIWLAPSLKRLVMQDDHKPVRGSKYRCLLMLHTDDTVTLTYLNRHSKGRSIDGLRWEPKHRCYNASDKCDLQGEK